MTQARPQECNNERSRGGSIPAAVQALRAAAAEHRFAKQTQTEKPCGFNATVTNRVYGHVLKSDPGHVPASSIWQNQVEKLNHFNASPYSSTVSVLPLAHRLTSIPPA